MLKGKLWVRRIYTDIQGEHSFLALGTLHLFYIFLDEYQ
jgi:hypothetical protein